MRTTEWQNAARHLRSWAPTLFVAVLLFGFAFIALEVTEGEPIAFDRRLMVAFRRCVRLVATNRAAMVARRCARHHRTGQYCGTCTAGHDRNHVPFCHRQTSRRFVRPDDGPERRPSQYPSQACLCASAPRYRHSTHSGLYAELSERARSKFGCLLSDARLDARSDASFPLSSHSSHNDRRDPDPVGRCQPHISRSSLSERCAGGLVLRHCVGANLPDAHVVFSAYWKDRAAE